MLEALGRNLQNMRLAKGVSLSKLASDAGLAKSNLSRLEQGSGNPTVDTIWRLAVQLNVPFSNLIAPVETPFGEDGVQFKLIEQGTDSTKVDAYWMSMAPRTRRVAEAHSSGSTESITVISGQLEITTEGRTTTLKAGDKFSFSADKEHEYRSRELWSTLLLTIVYAD
ncbi:XRE family transcriptional regulator [Vibrio hannami]|uniref:helix-turn-helix domain-containing protein n=1 Tax=Vibrio hannami TaxID=2717094 RepID=UPI00241070C6|nr:XRE family transcriptional regulator [Vibrio hannami]MDG3085628.1 XRE family transcriptional regulator [Vibrio hannami]